MGAGFCSLYHEIHYIEVRYIKVWVYFEKTETYWGHGLTVQLSSMLKLKQYFFFNGKNVEKICAKYKCQIPISSLQIIIFLTYKKQLRLTSSAAYVFKNLLGT